MIILNFILRLKLHSSFVAGINSNLVKLKRFLHVVQHDPSEGIFYVLLDKLDKQAVLRYNLNSQVMDIRSVHVPYQYKGRGLARLLTESAFTYAIENNYYLFLTCTYTQKYFLAYKNVDLRKRIIGPQVVLSAATMLEADNLDEIYDPDDVNKKK